MLRAPQFYPDRGYPASSGEAGLSADRYAP